MQRGDIVQAALDPAQGSEQAGLRPVIIVSRDAINKSSPVIIAIPLTGLENCPRIYPSQVVIKAGSGGLTKDSVALGEQVRAIAKKRLGRHLGRLSPEAMTKISAALKIAMDLP
jgi:mRNA interferase MazF